MRGLLALAAAATLFVFACGAVSAASPPPPTVKVVIHGSGKVVGAAGAIGCPKKCAAAPKAGTSVTLAAVPARGWRFQKWTGACTGTKLRCTLTIAAAVKSASAWFVKRVVPTPKPPPPPPPPAPAPGFNPQLVAGTWHGTFQAQEFPDNGTVDLSMTPNGTTAFTFALKMSGFPGGCAAGSADINQSVTAGTGPNTWGPNGFRIDETYPNGGQAHGTYDWTTGRLTASGSPDCNTSETWTLDGSLTGTTFNGTMVVIADPQTTVHIAITLARV